MRGSTGGYTLVPPPAETCPSAGRGRGNEGPRAKSLFGILYDLPAYWGIPEIPDLQIRVHRIHRIWLEREEQLASSPSIGLMTHKSRNPSSVTQLILVRSPLGPSPRTNLGGTSSIPQTLVDGRITQGTNALTFFVRPELTTPDANPEAVSKEGDNISNVLVEVIILVMAVGIIRLTQAGVIINNNPMAIVPLSLTRCLVKGIIKVLPLSLDQIGDKSARPNR